uniref:Uncharacterized protein n=1 Tax=Heterorhabditis bacteriophora TaxID=37862 RepID=A0A1I7X0G2_HETBA
MEGFPNTQKYDDIKRVHSNGQLFLKIHQNSINSYKSVGRNINATTELFGPRIIWQVKSLTFHSNATPGNHFNWQKALRQRKRNNTANKEKLIPAISTKIFDLIGLRHKTEVNERIACMVEHFSKFI